MWFPVKGHESGQGLGMTMENWWTDGSRLSRSASRSTVCFPLCIWKYLKFFLREEGFAVIKSKLSYKLCQIWPVIKCMGYFFFFYRSLFFLSFSPASGVVLQMAVCWSTTSTSTLKYQQELTDMTITRGWKSGWFIMQMQNWYFHLMYFCV